MAKVPTKQNLMRRGFHGPSICCLCKLHEEDTNHLFLPCPVTTLFWSRITTSLNIPTVWSGQNVGDASHRWWFGAQTHKARNWPPIICWGIWINRNKTIFMDTSINWDTSCSKLLANYNLISNDPDSKPPWAIILECIDTSYPWGYFDGLAQAEGCLGWGGGAVLHINNFVSYRIQVDLSRGTNNYAELNILKHLLLFARKLNCQQIQIFGDSQLIIN